MANDVDVRFALSKSDQQALLAAIAVAKCTGGNCTLIVDQDVAMNLSVQARTATATKGKGKSETGKSK